MSFLDRIESKLSVFFAGLFRQSSGRSKDSPIKCDAAGRVSAAGIAGAAGQAGCANQSEPAIEDTKAYRKSDLDHNKEESTTRVYCRIADPDNTAVREHSSLPSVTTPLVRFEVKHGLDKESAFEFGICQGIIGRSSGSLIELSDPNVSRMHARLEITATQTVIYDHNSTNGTKVNGRRITKQNLHNGDIISVGQTELCFAVIDQKASQAGSQKQKGRR